MNVHPLREAIGAHLGQVLTPEVAIRKVSPEQLVALPGFSVALEGLREEAELTLFSDGAASFDLETYSRLHEAGSIFAFAAMQGEELVGFAIVLRTSAPRRSGLFYVVDVIWAPEEGPAGKLLMLNIIRATEGGPLFITAPIGGRLHAGLLGSNHFRQTHAIFTSS